MLKLIFICLCFIVCFTTVFASNTITVSIMTFNIENGGTQIDFHKVVEAVKKSKADVVGIQEAWGNTRRLADELGWKYYDLRQHIVSRFPLYDAPTSQGKYIFIAPQPNQVIAMANIHLPDEPYGPYLIRDGATLSTVEKNELTVRLPSAMPTIMALTTLAKQHIPVFLTGDFNSPGHLDWTNVTVNKLANHRYAVNWPVTKTITAMGLFDSFRMARSDVIYHPGFTWPSGRKKILDSKDGFNPSERDPKDRIDFIFAANAKVLASDVIGEFHSSYVDIAIDPWPSDHRAVVSRFSVIPGNPPPNLKPIVQLDLNATPFIKVANKVNQNTPFIIRWGNAPGNGYDYIAITPVNASPTWSDAVHLYTHAAVNGSMTLTADNVQGNWIAWHRVAEAQWPLAAGVYQVKLMADDGDKVLASTSIEVES